MQRPGLLTDLKIELVRSGGFGNLSLRRAEDTEDLPAEEAAEVEQLVAGADLDELAARSPIRGRGADRFQYDLVVTEGEKARQVSITEDASSAELRALFERLLAGGGEPST